MRFGRRGVGEGTAVDGFSSGGSSVGIGFDSRTVFCILRFLKFIYITKLAHSISLKLANLREFGLILVWVF